MSLTSLRKHFRTGSYGAAGSVLSALLLPYDNYWSPPVQPRCTRSNTEGRLCIMPEKKVSAPAADAPAAEGKTRKSTKAPARRGRPPLAPELYVEMGGEQYNITDIIDRAKADYRTTHKVGVQSCKVYVKPEEGAAYYVINKFSGKLEL